MISIFISHWTYANVLTYASQVLALIVHFVVLLITYNNSNLGAEHFTCAQQKQWGNCNSDESLLREGGYCQKTCGTCAVDKCSSGQHGVHWFGGRSKGVIQSSNTVASRKFRTRRLQLVRRETSCMIVLLCLLRLCFRRMVPRMVVSKATYTCLQVIISLI